MINRRHLLFFMVLLGLAIIGQKLVDPEKTVTHKKKTTIKKVKTTPPAGERVPTSIPPVKKAPPKEPAPIKNDLTENWQSNLEKGLRLQGGEDVKDIEITKVDSFTWKHQGVALKVESVIVSVSNQKNVKTKFRALVDAQTGKVLQTWDRPVIDPINPREKAGIKIDPRYFQ